MTDKHNEILMVEFIDTVKVRKYDIDSEKLSKILYDAKVNMGYSNKYISEQLNLPMTLVAHYFRKDKCFAIPDADIWYELKSLLNIQTDEFDAAITEFEYRDGVYEKAQRVYMTNGIAPTILAVGGGEKICMKVQE